MAYPAATGPGYGHEPATTSSLFTAILGWLGAAISLGLVVGLIWWAYDIAMRDSRAVPVVRAMEGPARVAPQDPGGYRAPHSGYAVNDIASAAPRAPVGEEITLAPPPAPVEDSDVPPQIPGTAPDRDVIRNSIDRALLDALGVEDAPDAAPGAEDSPGGLRRPQPRPNAPRADVSRARTAPDPLPYADGTDPANAQAMAARDIPPGTRLVQLGAFSSETVAAEEWARLTAEFATYFDGKRPVYEQTDTAGATIWRLRAHGFDDRAAARRFCEVLLASQAECIPVLTR